MHVCTSWCLRCDCKAQSVRRHWRWRGRGETGGAPGWCPLQTSSSPSAEKESVRPALVCRPSILQRRCIFPQRCSSVTRTLVTTKKYIHLSGMIALSRAFVRLFRLPMSSSVVILTGMSSEVLAGW